MPYASSDTQNPFPSVPYATTDTPLDVSSAIMQPQKELGKPTVDDAVESSVDDIEATNHTAVDDTGDNSADDVEVSNTTATDDTVGHSVNDT